jgi:GNAT superfamily N-acetyltransferase
VHGLPHGCALLRAGPADLVPYGAISRQTFSDTYGATHAAAVVARHVAERFDDAQLRAELADPLRTVLAVMHAGHWVAYAVLRSGSAPVELTGRHPVEMERFYVDRAWHGGGVAAPLMAAGLDAARQQGCEVAWLGVWEQNSRAIRFYTRCGFADVGRTTYLFDGHAENDVVMATPL